MRMFCVLMVLGFIGSTAALAHQNVHYEIRYVADVDPWLEITATFEGDGGGMVSIYLPTEMIHGGVNHSHISNVEVLSDYSELENLGENHYLIYHAPDGDAVLRYRISGIGNETPRFAAPWETAQLVSSQLVHLNAGRSLALPSWSVDGYDWDEDITVRVDWIDLPRHWSTADSYGRGRQGRRFNTSVIDLFESRFIAGNIETTTRHVAGTRIQVAILGRWPFGVRRYADKVAALAQAHHEFWGDENQSGYLATLIAIDGFGDEGNLPALTANAGGNASTIFAARNTTMFALESTISHEYLHRWIDNAFGQPEAPFQSTRWFTEGFTNFYAAYIPYRVGVIDRSDYLIWLFGTYINQSTSSYGNLTQTQMTENWDYDTAMTDVPYWRGHLLAANWHTAIVQSTEGETYLHDIVFEFRANQDALRASGEPWTWNSEDIISLLEEYGFDFVREDYQRVLVEGGDVELTADTNGPCLIPFQSGTSNSGDEDTPLRLGRVAFPLGPMTEEDMSIAQRVACRTWLDLN